MSESIGIDYSTRKVSWAILDEDGQILVVDELALPRGADFLTGVNAILDYVEMRLLPDILDTSHVAIESPITGASLNRLTAAQMAIVSGALLARVFQRTDHVHMVPPAKWKKAAVGNGNADKVEVARVMRVRHRAQINSDDVADAIGIATWMHKEGSDGP